MKIVDVCAFMTPHGGGVKTYIEQKLRIGPELGHEIVVIAPGDHDETIHYSPHARLVILASPRFPLDRKYWYFADEAALHAAISAENPDFLEASSPWRSADMVAGWPGAAPRAIVMHADPLAAYAYRVLEPVLSRESIDRRFDWFWENLRGYGRSFDRVVCASQELRERLRDGGVANTALHRMGVDDGIFSPDRRDPKLRARMLAACGLPESAHLLIGIGRMAAEKRWPLVIDAVAAASQSLPIGLMIFGEGRHLTRNLKHIGGNPHIRIMTPERNRERFAAMLASADALVHGSDAETFGMAIAEARASGLPVIVPDRGAAADHALDGGGVMYRSGNALSAAHAIESYLRADLPRPPARVLTMQDHFAGLFADYEAILRERGRRVA